VSLPLFPVTTVGSWPRPPEVAEAMRAYRRRRIDRAELDRIADEAVIGTIAYDHPVITRESVAAQRRWAEISGADRIHYCGAYWGWGFHEDGCWSALRACERLRALEPAVKLGLAA